MANSRMRRLSGANSLPSHFAALDFGNKKIACLIAKNDGDETDIIGGAVQQSRGISDGAVTDMARLERTIRIVVERAENHADQRIQSVVLGVAGSHLKSETLVCEISVAGRAITQTDLAKLKDLALAKVNLGKNTLLTHFCIGYKLDDHAHVSDPIGMMAETLEARFSVMSAPRTMVQNLVECCRRAGLRVIKLMPASIASGVGSLTQEEQREGAVSVDIGALSTSVALFHNNTPVWQGSIPIGGEHVSRDLAHGLGTSLAAAERLKTLYGNAMPNTEADQTLIEVATLGPMGRLEAQMMPRGDLQIYIGPRVTELVDLTRRLLFSAMHDQNWLPMRVVLTGGGSQLAGFDHLFQSRLNLPTRIGVPEKTLCLGPQFENPYVARVAGLVSLANQPQVVSDFGDSRVGSDRVRYLAKIWQWLKENV